MNLTKSERKENIDFILGYAKKAGFDIYICGLEYSLASDSSKVKVHFNSYETEPSIYENQFEELFTSVQSLTAKEDLLVRLKQRLITLLALRLNCTKVFLGPNATRLAGQLLTAVSQGRGAQIAHEIVSPVRFKAKIHIHLYSFSCVSQGFADSRTGVTLMRPMREFVDKEVAYLAHFLHVDSVSVPTLSSKVLWYEL